MKTIKGFISFILGVMLFFWLLRVALAWAVFWTLLAWMVIYVGAGLAVYVNPQPSPFYIPVIDCPLGRGMCEAV